jgi:hypothetical protein
MTEAIAFSKSIILDYASLSRGEAIALGIALGLPTSKHSAFERYKFLNFVSNIFLSFI